MTTETRLGGTFTPAGTTMRLHRMGYGAMQLAGAGVWGPPRDPDEAAAVLREAVGQGVNHIDTSDFYGPHITNRLIRDTLAPYPAGLTIVTKVGFLRGEDRSWNVARSRDELVRAVESNLETLGVGALDVVNLRLGGAHGPQDEPVEAALAVLAELRDEGLIRHLGLSTVTPGQYRAARAVAPIVCVQNHYNLAHRGDDAFIDELARDGVAYVPYFPLGGFSPLQSDALDRAAAAVGATPQQTALAWLLQRSPNILVIPGTSSRAHLIENLAAASLSLPDAVMAALTAM